MTAKAKAQPLPSGWHLAKASLGMWKRHLKTFTLLTALVALPANLIQLLLASSDGTISTYISLVSVLMNLALVWAALQLEGGAKTVRLRQAYYEGTASFVRFLLASAVIVVELIPITVGLFLYNVGVAGAAPGTTSFERVVVGLLAFALTLPSVFWVNRSVLALVGVPSGDLRPVAAVRDSWRRVKGHSWQVLAKLLFLMLAAAALVAIPAIILVFLYERTTNRGFLALLQVFASLVILPFIDIYLVKLNRELT